VRVIDAHAEGLENQKVGSCAGFIGEFVRLRAFPRDIRIRLAKLGLKVSVWVLASATPMELIAKDEEPWVCKAASPLKQLK
jgi:hypothetical protein